MPEEEKTKSNGLAAMSVDALAEEVERLRAELTDRDATIKTLTEDNKELNDVVTADMTGKLKADIMRLGRYKSEDLKGLPIGELQVKLDALKRVIPSSKAIAIAADEEEKKGFWTVGDLRSERFKEAK
jgi:ribosomal protein L29